jgi:hypothetical protein
MAWEHYGYSGQGVANDLNHLVGVSTTASDSATANMVLSTAEPVYDVTAAPDLWANVDQIAQPANPVLATATVHHALPSSGNRNIPPSSSCSEGDTMPHLA